ncbi:putative metal-dependent enzyme (double-stranded beta helix superfamily) [Naumannella cuiyingiana]|uniref:Putative metal-dependent enzyme (Double-stranded beta helix superfamily) n=1 Tax=Naumannella cuiyingiana TaxID=1347891 RepID=A0A7Z0D7S5_9ACTN|nr:cysteine dioxygenase family protein [Naumannella cuiyingiana]NYI70481.1 putative metal-dependent enzyme (double-stranded beta helix superfamily) [Naumannella cuiyingiana]
MPDSSHLELARSLARTPELWERFVDFDATSRYYHRLLARPDREAWLLTWLPGQGTDWHDHGASAGAFVVLGGTLREQVAREDRAGVLRPGADLRWGAGRSRAFGTDHVHRVTNPTLEPAISLHVYGPRLTVMNHYSESGTELVRSDRRLAGADW